MAISKNSQEYYAGRGWLDSKQGVILDGLISLSGITDNPFMGQSFYVREENSTIFEVALIGQTSGDTQKQYWRITTMPVANSASAITLAINTAFAACSVPRSGKYSALVKVGTEIRVEHDDLSDPSSEFYNKPATYFVSAIDGVNLTWTRKNEGEGGAIYWEGDPDERPTYPD